MTLPVAVWVTLSRLSVSSLAVGSSSTIVIFSVPVPLLPSMSVTLISKLTESGSLVVLSSRV
jgi:hypothetical protein